MALVECYECDQQVSTKAKACPHCGAEGPFSEVPSRMGPSFLSPTGEVLLGFFIGIIGIVLLALLFSFLFGVEKSDAPIAEYREEDTKRNQCRYDLDCWGRRHIPEAAAYCQPRIERLGKYNHEWTNGAFEQIFHRYKWKDRDRGHVTYIGSKVKFQNGFGAYQRHVYECDFDPGTNMVFDVRAFPM